MLDGRVTLGKVNCDQWPGVCQSAVIRGYPTVRLFVGSKDGSRQDINGIVIQSHNAEVIVKLVEEQIGKASKSLPKTEL